MKTVYTFGAILALILAIPFAIVGPTKLAEMGRAEAAATPTRTVEDVRKQWGSDKPKQVAKFTPQERARWACSEAIERMAVRKETIRWTRRSQWLTQEVHPGVWEVHAHFMARNRLGDDVNATHACTLKLD